jgi:DNA-binding CsgD family transcriptional regulator
MSSLITTTVNFRPLRHLQRDWERRRHDPRTLAEVNSWGLPGDPVTDLDDVVIRAGFGKSATDSVADAYFFQLISRAKHDDLAARICLQRVMPSVLAIARRRGRITPGGFDQAMTECLATAWMQVRTFPADRRTKKIAANLVRDIEYHGFVRERRMKKHPSVSLAERHHDVVTYDLDPHHTDDELNDVLTLAEQHGLSNYHATLLRRIASGEPNEDIAASYNISPRTVRDHRATALAHVREILAKVYDEAD